MIAVLFVSLSEPTLGRGMRPFDLGSLPVQPSALVRIFAQMAHNPTCRVPTLLSLTESALHEPLLQFEDALISAR